MACISRSEAPLKTSSGALDSSKACDQREACVHACVLACEGVCGSDDRTGDVAQMVERSLSMREVLGSIPSFSTSYVLL